jgi:type II secretory pathway component PulM
MISLRDRWRRNRLLDFFASMRPLDRAVAIGGVAAAALVAALFVWLWQPRAATLGRSPAPLILDFDGSRAVPS